MKVKKTMVVIAVILLLTACTSIRVDFGNGMSFTLLDYRAMYNYVDEYQLISGSFPYLGEDMVFESWTCVDYGGISLVAFLPTGQTFAKISWDGRNINYESEFMPQGRQFAQYIISDLQLCYASYEDLEENYVSAGMSLSETHRIRTTVRTLKKGGNVVERVTIEPGLITVENTAAGYKYQIESL